MTWDCWADRAGCEPCLMGDVQARDRAQALQAARMAWPHVTSWIVEASA